MRISFTAAVCALTFFGLVSCDAPNKNADEATRKIFKDENGIPVARLSDDVRPEHYTLSLKIDPTEERFTGSVDIDVALANPATLIWLHGRFLDVTKATLVTSGGLHIEAVYQEVHKSGIARLDLASQAPAGKAVLHFEYSAPFDHSLAGLFRIDQGDLSYALTQFQSIAARMAFPGFDEPAFKVPFDISIEARSEDVVISNTPEVSAEITTDGWTRHTFETTRPLPTYLLAFAVGPYDLVEGKPLPPGSLRATPVPLRGLSARGKGSDMGFTLEHTISSLEYLEDYFQIPFPYTKLDSIAAPDFFSGAMENAGAIVAHETLMVVGDQASLSQRRSSALTHAHEISHQWFGDLVTPVWWDDIWLNEAFATWMGIKTADAWWPEGGFARYNLVGALGAMTNDSLASARQIRQPIEHNDDIDTAFDGITYQKGGGVLAMFESYLGEEAFRKGVQTHLKRYADSVASSDDFMASLADGSGRPDVIPAFKSFIDQPGVPLVSVKLDCSRPEAPMLDIKQNRYRPLGSPIKGDSIWIIPMGVAYEVNGKRHVERIMLRDAEETVALEAAACPTLLMPNADGAGYYRFALDEAGWSALAANTEFLNVAETLVYLDSLAASYKAGETSSAALLKGLQPLVLHRDSDVVTSLAYELELLTSNLLTSEAKSRVDAKMTAMFQPRYDALATADSEEDLILKVVLARFLALVSLDPDIRADMAARAARRIGLDGPADPGAVSDDLLETVLSVGVQDLGDPFFTALLEQARSSTDQSFRASSFGALARVEDLELAERLQAEFTAEAVTINERLSLIFRQLARPVTQDTTWTWVQNNFGSVLDGLPGGPFAASVVGGIGGQLCKPRSIAEFQALVLKHADSAPGYERGLAQSLESIALCIALKEVRTSEFSQAFVELKTANKIN